MLPRGVAVSTPVSPPQGRRKQPRFLVLLGLPSTDGQIRDAPGVWQFVDVDRVAWVGVSQLPGSSSV